MCIIVLLCRRTRELQLLTSQGQNIDIDNIDLKCINSFILQGHWFRFPRCDYFTLPLLYLNMMHNASWSLQHLYHQTVRKQHRRNASQSMSRNGSWRCVHCTNPQGVEWCTFCSGSDLNFVFWWNSFVIDLAHLHPRKVTLNRRVGHVDAKWIWASSVHSGLRSPRAWLLFTVQAAVQVVLANPPGNRITHTSWEPPQLLQCAVKNVLPQSLVCLPFAGTTPSHPKQLSKLIDVLLMLTPKLHRNPQWYFASQLAKR